MLATEHTLDPEALYTINAAGFSATADAFARDPHSQGLWFLSMVGSQTALKAIWASLLKQPPDVAHLIQGADGMALSGGYERCGIPYQTIGTWTTKISQAAGEWGLARPGLHQARRIRIGERPVPSPGSNGEGSAGHPLPLPGQEEPTAVASLLGRLAVATWTPEGRDHPAPIGGSGCLPLQPQPRIPQGGPLGGGGFWDADPTVREGRNRWIAP